jgi:6-pyruvoyl-tetrahydropterin synthase-like protein/tetratricopeptide repeat protein
LTTETPSRKRFGLADAITALALLAVWALLFSYFRPSLLLLDTMTAGGDTPSFHHPIEHLRNVLLPAGYPQGWDPGNFGGYAPYRSYFLPPSLIVVALSWFIPFNVAFKLVTVLGIFLLPLATVVCLRAMDYPFPIPAVGAAASLLLLFNQGNSMWGANIPSTLAGEFSFSIAFALAVLFVGLLYRGIRTGRHRAGLAVLLALVGLCHPVPFISAAGAGLYFLLDPATLRRNLVYLAWVYAAAALLMAFWLVPLIAGLPYATSIHWEWQFQSWLDVLPPMLILPALMAAIDGIRLWRSRQAPAAGHYVLFSLLVAAAAFCAANSVGVPDIRFIPFAQFVVLLLALDLLSAFLPALPASGLPGLTLVAATLGFVQFNAGYIPNWVRWNYEGIQSKPQYPVLQQLMAALKGSLADPRVGYEHSPSYDTFGSMRIFESLPLLAHRATLEGVLLQTAVTSPFVYYIQSLVSEQGTSVIPGYAYPDADPVRGTPRLDLFNVRDFLAVSDKVKAALDKDPRWTRAFVLEPYVIYRRTETPAGYVRVPKFRPVLLETANWKKDFHRWFDKDGLLDVPLVAARTVPAPARGFFPLSAKSPTDLPRVPERLNCAVRERVSSEEIEFTTSCPGVPHYISVAYHPNWRADGAFGVFLASPSFMMVVPQQPVVRLRFGRSATDWMGILATLAGIGLCVGLPRRGAVPAVSLPHVASRRFHVAKRALLTIAVFVIAVSVVRKIGSQYFARRAWHAFETQDFARARREYDRTLLFGRGYASSADAMFWRASSMFRMDDCAAAVPAYEELITRAPESVWAAESQYQIGICLARLGQHGSAAAAFQRTVERYEHNRWSNAAADRLREIHGATATGTR